MDGERVYVPLQLNVVQALDRETGTPVWRSDVATIWAPVLRDGLLYVAASDAVHALDARTGALRWRAPIDRRMIVPLTATSDLLIGVMEPDAVVAFAIADGRVVWRRSLGTYPNHAAASDGRRVVFALSDSRVVALNLADGDPLWEQHLEGDLGPPLVVRERVILGSSSNYLYAFDDRGRLAWKWRTGGDVVGVSADATTGAYYASLDNVLRAVNQSNGNQRWIKEMPTRPGLPPLTLKAALPYEEVVVVTGVTSEIGAFSTKTGAAVGRYSPPSDIQGGPLIDPSLKPYKVAVVVITRDGRAIGLRPTAMALAEPKISPFDELPGRRLERDRITR